MVIIVISSLMVMPTRVGLKLCHHTFYACKWAFFDDDTLTFEKILHAKRPQQDVIVRLADLYERFLLAIWDDKRLFGAVMMVVVIRAEVHRSVKKIVIGVNFQYLYY